MDTLDVPPEQDPKPQKETLQTIWRAVLAEFLASAFFVFTACGAATTTANFAHPGPTVIAIALSFGLSIFILAFTFGHISGGHINPAISLTFMLMKKIEPLRGICYMVAQFVGMLVGVFFLSLCTPVNWLETRTTTYSNGTTSSYVVAIPNCYANNAVNSESTPGSAFLLEIVLTFAFLIVVCAATDSNKSNQIMIPYSIGMAVTVCHLIAVPIDGCSINPTRSFASAAVAYKYAGCGNVFNNHWIFWAGPFIGGPLGGLVYTLCFHDGGNQGGNLIGQYRNHLSSLIAILPGLSRSSIQANSGSEPEER
jgi:MIP family channel proteins